MTIRNLDALFQPKSVTVIGASARAGSIGAMVWSRVRSGGFAGPIWPVNPKYADLDGCAVFSDAGDLLEAPSVAVVCTPGATWPDVIAKLGKLGTRAELAELCDDIGPRCTGRTHHRDARGLEQVPSVGEDCAAVEICVLGIDRPDRPREAPRTNPGPDHRADTARACGSADYRNGFGLEQRIEIANRHERPSGPDSGHSAVRRKERAPHACRSDKHRPSERHGGIVRLGCAHRTRRCGAERIAPVQGTASQLFYGLFLPAYSAIGAEYILRFSDSRNSDSALWCCKISRMNFHAISGITRNSLESLGSIGEPRHFRYCARGRDWNRTQGAPTRPPKREEAAPGFLSPAIHRTPCRHQIDLRNGAPECSRISLKTIFGQAFCATSISEMCEAR